MIAAAIEKTATATMPRISAAQRVGAEVAALAGDDEQRADEAADEAAEVAADADPADAEGEAEVDAAGSRRARRRGR